MGRVDELKAKNENLFERNTILLNENERLKKENTDLRDNYDQFKAIAEPEIERLRESNSYMFDTIALKSQQIEKLEKENAELKGIKDVATLIRANNSTKVTLMQLNNKLVSKSQQLTKAKEIILKLYNAGRDVLMCRTEEKAYDNLDNAINDRSIEQFLKEIEK